jgi:hypothetical protein
MCRREGCGLCWSGTAGTDQKNDEQQKNSSHGCHVVTTSAERIAQQPTGDLVASCVSRVTANVDWFGASPT